MTQSTAIATVGNGKRNEVLQVNLRDLNDAAALIFESNVFGDLQSKEAAAIKIVAGNELGFSPFQSMSMFDFIQGRPTLNAHGKATLINSSGDFRLTVKELTPELCTIALSRKSDGGDWKQISVNSFSIQDAKQAELTTGKNAHSWKKYPRNMLFARCVSNIWRWECAELNKRRFSHDDIVEFDAPELIEDDAANVEYIDGEVVDTETGEIVDVTDNGQLTTDNANSNEPQPDNSPAIQPETSAAVTSNKDTAVELARKLKEDHGIEFEALAMQFLPEGVAKFGSLTEEQAAEIVPGLQELLKAKLEAGSQKAEGGKQ